MNDIRGKILWIDDEIDHLKPHILFLEEKGYEITPSSSGKDGIEKISSHSYDLILIDQFMPGLDGIETITQIKSSNPSTPIIMITKSEEEWLMDEAIYKKIDHLLIKPVNPNQIFVACKQVLEDLIIHSEKSKNEYLSQFQEIESLVDQANSIDDWWEVYTKLVKWQFDFENQSEESLGQILQDQFQSCNKKFSSYIIQNYPQWVNSKERPTLSCDIFS
ncbi:MAG: response regulator, partial [Candidatus Neomarinimicrobiota bacterium]|nr:response regulator [Candidatus Neomarinimicrobiota bacterium]